MAASPGFFDLATSCAASAVELATRVMAWGSLRPSHMRVCPSGLGWESTTATSSRRVPGFAPRLRETGRSTSRWMSRSVSKANVSSVADTEPSMEFSSGTNPRSTSPASTAEITCGTERIGTASPAARSGCVPNASSANVPRGPRYPTFTRASYPSRWVAPLEISRSFASSRSRRCAPARPPPQRPYRRAMEPSDALVFFGMTGDLAYKKIFPALYNMAKRGVLKVPVVGVASTPYHVDALRARARASVEEHGGGVDDEAAFAHLSASLDYVSGNYTDIATFTELRARLADAQRPA